MYILIKINGGSNMGKNIGQGKVTLTLTDGTVIENEDATVIQNYTNDGWFEKLYMTAFISTISDISNAKLKIALYVMSIKDREGHIILSQRQIAERTGLSLPTVNTTIKILVNSKFLVKAGKVFKINPYVMYQGKSRTILLRDVENPSDAVIYKKQGKIIDGKKQTALPFDEAANA